MFGRGKRGNDMNEIEQAIKKDVANCQVSQSVSDCSFCCDFTDMNGAPCQWTIAKTTDDIMNLCKSHCAADHCDECAFLKFTKPLRYIHNAIESAESADYWRKIPCDPDEIIEKMGLKTAEKEKTHGRVLRMLK